MQITFHSKFGLCQLEMTKSSIRVKKVGTMFSIPYGHYGMHPAKALAEAIRAELPEDWRTCPVTGDVAEFKALLPDLKIEDLTNAK